MFVVSTFGLAYAQWGDTVSVSSALSFGILDPAFWKSEEYPLMIGEYHEDPNTGEIRTGEYKGKNVGTVEGDYLDEVEPGAYKTLVLELFNAYPGYLIKCDFALKNIGTLPAHIAGIVIIDESATLVWNPELGALVDASGNPVILITFSPNPVCTTLLKEEIIRVEMSVLLEQDAIQNAQYTFTVTIGFDG